MLFRDIDEKVSACQAAIYQILPRSHVKGRRWSGREDLNLCPFTDKCKIFKELQEKNISVHSEFIKP